MREFFRGWKRKAGCLTLVLVLLFLVGWVRSWSHFDCVNVPIGNYSEVTAASSNHVLGLSHYTIEDPSESSFDFWSNPETGRIEAVLGLDGSDVDGINCLGWSIRGAGFFMGRAEQISDGTFQVRFAVIPYWLIVFPMTLLSACLLLSRAFSSTVRKTIGPASQNPMSMMRDFFNGRRKKFGVVTLVLAVILAGAWIRSRGNVDCLAEVATTHNRHIQHDRLCSLRDGIVWVRARNLDTLNPYTEWYGRLTTGNPEPLQDFVFGIPFEWRLEFAGFGYADGLDSSESNSCSLLQIPYYAIVLPLTLLSTCLLLIKPRPPKPPESP